MSGFFEYMISPVLPSINITPSAETFGGDSFALTELKEENAKIKHISIKVIFFTTKLPSHYISNKFDISDLIISKKIIVYELYSIMCQ
ncbi:hypothetical protein GCM10008906_36560 [Clostridium oceanicum]|uniref:Carrier domain-containing protein n=1 Tax=Clostridium oceanicum TaxID=1543 RepID=A0ABN1JW99_9CLOT